MTLFHRRKHSWLDVDPGRATRLSDARLQLHHAAQLVAAMGISYLPKADDDSHTNMEWIAGALASTAVGGRPFRLGVRPDPSRSSSSAATWSSHRYSLHGNTIDDAAAWIAPVVTEARPRLAARYTLAKHYTIPPHPVARGVPFDTTDAATFERAAALVRRCRRRAP